MPIAVPRSTSSMRCASGCRPSTASSAPSGWPAGAAGAGAGGRVFAVGDVVVLGANARDRLGVVNGTTAVIRELDVAGRAMTVRTLEDEPAKTVRLPGWYLDAAGQ